MELWKDIKDYEGAYQVSNLGRVRSLDRYVDFPTGRHLICGRVLMNCSHVNGYKWMYYEDYNKLALTI